VEYPDGTGKLNEDAEVTAGAELFATKADATLPSMRPPERRKTLRKAMGKQEATPRLLTLVSWEMLCLYFQELCSSMLLVISSPAYLVDRINDKSENTG
jgi:hypothetical protein